MSYILDALQKSEAARRSQQGPDLSLLEAAPDNQERAVRRRLRWGLLLALGVNALLLAAFWYQHSGSGTSSPANEAAGSNGGEIADAAPGPADTSVAAAPVALPPQAVLRQPVPTTVVSEPVPLTLHTHVYASDPAHREVSINGSFYRVGDQVGPALLEAITADGVRLRAGDRSVQLRVGDSWQP